MKDTTWAMLIAAMVAFLMLSYCGIARSDRLVEAALKPPTAPKRAGFQ